MYRVVKSAVAAKKSAQRCATRRQDACDPLPKNEIALLSPEDVSSAISMSYESPKRFVRWQPELVRPDCQFVFRQAIGGRRFPVSTRLASVNLASLAGHKICFHESHINYNRSHNQCGANRLFFGWLSTSGSSLVVATRFYPGAQKTFRSSFASLSASTKGVIASANRSAFTLSQSLATPFADPFVGLDGRNLRDAESYTENNFSDQLFVCFIFREMIYFSCCARFVR